jgi:hypothetical protein
VNECCSAPDASRSARKSASRRYQMTNSVAKLRFTPLNDFALMSVFMLLMQAARRHAGLAASLHGQILSLRSASARSFAATSRSRSIAEPEIYNASNV